MKTGSPRRSTPATAAPREAPTPPQIRNHAVAFAALIASVVLAPAPAHAGLEVLAYPFARAFGSPSEKDLAACRDAFREFQQNRATVTVVVPPTLVRSRPAGNGAQWRTDLATELARRLGSDAGPRIQIADSPPKVAAAELGANQLRYAWHRACQYRDTLKSEAKRAAYTLFTEVWTADGKVAAIHVFLYNPSGQLAYCRWFNSHQFGTLPNADIAVVSFIAKRMQRDLTLRPEELFPPYGVG